VLSLPDQNSTDNRRLARAARKGIVPVRKLSFQSFEENILLESRRILRIGDPEQAAVAWMMPVL
jgi:hypothetical protein